MHWAGGRGERAAPEPAWISEEYAAHHCVRAGIVGYLERDMPADIPYEVLPATESGNASRIQHRARCVQHADRFRAAVIVPVQAVQRDLVSLPVRHVYIDGETAPRIPGAGQMNARPGGQQGPKVGGR